MEIAACTNCDRNMGLHFIVELLQYGREHTNISFD
jgi:hypothetical protein